jgi:hypothetical protein
VDRCVLLWTWGAGGRGPAGGASGGCPGRRGRERGAASACRPGARSGRGGWPEPPARAGGKGAHSKKNAPWGWVKSLQAPGGSRVVRVERGKASGPPGAPLVGRGSGGSQGPDPGGHDPCRRRPRAGPGAGRERLRRGGPGGAFRRPAGGGGKPASRGVPSGSIKAWKCG